MRDALYNGKSGIVYDHVRKEMGFRSALTAIGLGALLIQNGLQEMVVCGGAQEANPFSVGSFDGISAFSVRESEPEKASCPFDRDRDGLVPGGGAATVILEDYESAVRRGAPILAEVLGYGFSSNGDHISSPNVDGPMHYSPAGNKKGLPCGKPLYKMCMI